MLGRNLISFAAVAAVAGVACAQGTVTYSLTSSRNGQTITAGTSVDWTVSLTVSGGDNAGLALWVADLVQDPANPEKFDISYGNAGTIGTVMDDFSRPLGISNPGEGGNTTGYVGVQRSPAGETYKNLIQIGGAQNTFGATGGTIGTDFNVNAGIGQGGAQVVLTGSFNAPATDGLYTFRLESPISNTLDNVTPPTPPAHWPVSRATSSVAGATFSFTVGASAEVLGDSNCDGLVNFDDIDCFVAALIGEAAWDTCGHGGGCTYAGVNDIDGNTSVNFDDIDPFIVCLIQGTCD